VSAINTGDRFTYVSSGGSLPSEVLTEPAEATATGFKLKGKLNPNGLPTPARLHSQSWAGPA